MTDCPNGDIRDQLPDYVHDRLDTAARALVAAHVATCASCAAEVALLATARRVLTAAAPRIDTARVVAALPAPPRATARPALVRPAQPARRSAFHLTTWRIAAVVATIAIGGASIAVIRGITQPDVTAVSVPPRAVEAPTPTEALADNNVALPDGGRIGELSDDDVQSLLNDIDQLDGVPDASPQPAVPALHTGGTL
jgi:anti-sigma factor RsiW